MPLVALAGWLVLVVLGVVVRAAWQLHLTGKSGIVGVHSRASVLEMIAGALLALGFFGSLAGSFVGTPITTSTAWLGAIVVALGTLGMFVSQLTMARSWRIGVDPDERTELVTRGIFAFVRNPIFTWLTVASIGIALACPTPLALVAPVIVAVAVELQVRFVEEPYLLRTHGDVYRAYARATGRFVPGLGRLAPSR